MYHVRSLEFSTEGTLVEQIGLVLGPAVCPPLEGTRLLYGVAGAYVSSAVINSAVA